MFFSDNKIKHLAIAFFSASFLFGAITPVTGAEIESSIARGGRLYDKWYAENKAAKPATEHTAYPKGNKYGKDSWRCKECHGWDYMGKDGAYASGGHATGIKGIAGAAGKDTATIVAVLADSNHGYIEEQLNSKDRNDIALFVSRGQIDVYKHIDRQTKKPKGSAAKGEVYFNTVCAGCHGFDGKKFEGPALGSVADNPYEMIHKVMNGHPGEPMPALRALDIQIAVDIITYLPSLPK
jgi:thiosulfate dehydrogenase